MKNNPDKLAHINRTPATVYVMKISGNKGLRIGIHSTSNRTRENQVSNSLGLKTKIVWSKEVQSKAHALAAEALAHLYLCEYERRRKIGNKKIQIFYCSPEHAREAYANACRTINKSYSQTPVGLNT